MAERFSAFGKIPSVGDFFRLGTAGAFVATWDQWVQSAMLSAQGALGASWDDHYMSAPIWRFCLSPGLAGGSGAIGVLMPSVDRVGRRFPLTLFAQAANPLQTFFTTTDMFERLETLALSALDDDMTRDRLDDGLAALAPPPENGAAVGRRTIVTDSAGGLCASLAAAEVSGRLRQPTLWSTALEDGHRLMMCDGLPSAQEALSLFDLSAPLWQEARA